MRLCFFGSAAIAVAALDRMLDAGHVINAVFTQPDRPAGRGSSIRMTLVKQRALELGLPVEQPERLDSAAVETLSRYNPELVVVVAYGLLIPKDMLVLPVHGFINLHASILPRYRGAAPVPYALLNGDAETGVTVFRLNERFDCGDILAVEKLPILPDDTSATVLEKLAPLGADLVAKVVGEFKAGWVQPLPQEEAKATRAPKFKKNDGQLDWKETPDIIDRKVRAFQPWPLAFCFYKGGRKTKRLVILKVEESDMAGREISADPGEIISTEEGFVVACGEGRALQIIEVKPEGRNKMTAEEFLRGARLEPGMKFF